MSLNDYMKNLNFQIKAKEIGEASWGDSRRKYKPMTMPSVDTLLSSGVQLNKQQNSRNEMVQKYIQEQDQPVRVNIDGEVRDFKFHQVEKPQLVDVDDDIRNYEQMRDEIAIGKTETMIEAEHEIDAIVERMNTWKRRKTLIDYHKNQLIANMREIQDSGDGSRYAEWQESRAQYAQLDDQDDQSDYNLHQLEDLLQAKKDAFGQIYRNFEGNELDLEALKAKIQDGEKRNKDEMKAYEQELLALNVGKLSTKQEPMETDEEYFERLQRLADTPYADGSTQEKAEIEQKQELRDNLMAITRNQELINQVVNGLYADGRQTIYELNKVFPIFKERFLKVYGANNKNIQPEDITNFAQKIIDRPEVEQKNPQVEGEYQIITNTYNADEDNNVPPDIDGEEYEDTLLIIDEEGNDNFFKYYEGTMTEIVDGKRISKLNPLFYSETNELGSYININLPSTFKEILKKLGAGALRSLGINTSTTRVEFIKMMIELGVDETPLDTFYVGEIQEGFGAKAKEKHVFGVGMNSDPKDIPAKISFGDNVLDLKKLYLKNIFGISDQKGRKIHGIKNTPVSDNFVKVIFNIINGKDLLGKDLSTLTSGEKHFLELVLATSGLHKKHNTGGSTQSIEKVKHDYKIIIGEIESGNNGSEIKKKLYEILYSLAHLGAINKGQAQKQYKEIVKSFF